MTAMSTEEEIQRLANEIRACLGLSMEQMEEFLPIVRDAREAALRLVIEAQRYTVGIIEPAIYLLAVRSVLREATQPLGSIVPDAATEA